VFGKRINLFTIMGFTVRVDISWIIIAVLISWSLAGAVFPSYVEDQSKAVYWIMGIAGAIGLFASITFHELSHSVVARRFGLPIEGITLFIFGGVSEMRREPDSPAAEFYMAIAGPAASIAAGVIFLALAYRVDRTGWSVPVMGVVRYLGVINLVLAGFNLIPAFPLDGGRVLRSALWKFKKDLHEATVLSARIGTVFGFILIFAGVYFLIRGSVIGGFWWIFIGIFLRSASRRAILQSRIREALRGVKVRKLMKTDPVTLPAETPLETLEEEYLKKYDHDTFPVVENGSLKGVVDEDQVEGISREKGENLTAGEIARPCSDRNCVSAGDDAVKALHLLRWKRSGRMPVADKGRLAGIISMDDILRFLSLKIGLEEKTLRKPLD